MKSLISPLLAAGAFLLAALPCTLDAADLAVAQASKLTAADGAASDVFGTAVSVSGDVAIVGMPFDDDRGSNSGSAYLFARNQGGSDGWGQAGKLVLPDGVVGDEFGTSVSIADNRLVVGARRSDFAGSNRGSAHVFARGPGGAGGWVEVAMLTAADAGFQDLFGGAVAISGDWIVVGAQEDDDRGAQSGSAYVFGRNAGGADNWGQVAKLTADDGSANDLFGTSVAISGDRIVVGSVNGDGLVGTAGAAYVFARNAGGINQWGQVAKLIANDGALNDRFGSSVAIEDERVVIAARTEDGVSVDTGAAYVFERSGGFDNWGQVAKLTAADAFLGDQFGISVSLSGERVLVGAHFDDVQGSESGAAYVFFANQGGPGNWGQIAKVIPQDGAIDDRFGAAVSLAGDFAVVGAHQDDDAGLNSGAAYVFRLSGAGSNTVFSDGFED